MKATFRPVALAALIAFSVNGSAADTGPGHPATPIVDEDTSKPRLFVLSDIGNEPDDQMSFVRLLLYSNEIDIEGIVATTSTFQRNAIHPETFRAILEDFGKVRANLLSNAAGWPTAEQLASRVATGQLAYGMAATGTGKSSAGSKALIEAVDRQDARPLWVAAWGGTNTLAQALQDVSATRSAAQVDAFVAKLRVYAISDQDDAGPWLRRMFPKLFYVVSPSSQDANEFARATWTGISGDHFFRNGEGADDTTVTNEWLDANIRSKPPLGLHYPKFMFIMEGDTPSFLNLIGNGLQGFRSPSWGGWGGRYNFLQLYGETHPIWTQGGDSFVHIDSRDTVVGADGRSHVSDQATIWRWRQAYQNDFAARMDWTLRPFARANHAPRVVVNGVAGQAPLMIDATVGSAITLDASGTSDPDGQAVKYHWFSYNEAGFSPGVTMADVNIRNEDGRRATALPTAACRAMWLPLPPRRTCTGIAHVILAVTDTGTPQLTSYRRVIITVRSN